MSFEQIYLAAQYQDSNALKAALDKCCIDVRQGEYSPASKLAFEGNKAAVEFLLRHGAYIEGVARCAAQRGDKAYAEELLARGADINAVAYGAALAGDKEYAEELLNRGANVTAIAGGTALKGDKAYAEALLTRGANINAVAYGAALAGNKEYAEELLSRGANVTSVARGAARNGDKAYIVELLQRGAEISSVAYEMAVQGDNSSASMLIAHGASINLVACGAASRGDKEYVQQLLDLDGHNAVKAIDINVVARHAAQAGHKAYAEALIKNGAHIDALAHGAALGSHMAYMGELVGRGADIYWIAQVAKEKISILNNRSQLYYLSFFPPGIIPKLSEELEKIGTPVIIGAALKQRSIAIARHRQKGLSFEEAFMRTGAEYQGLLYVMMKYAMRDPLFEPLPLELVLTIFNSIAPFRVYPETINNFGMNMARTYLGAQLKVYDKPFFWQKAHSTRAKSFHQAIDCSKNWQEFSELITNQVAIFQGENPYNDSSIRNHYQKPLSNMERDHFYEVISFWQSSLSGTAETAQTPPQLLKEKGEVNFQTDTDFEEEELFVKAEKSGHFACTA